MKIRPKSATINGQTKTLKQWSRITGVSYSTLLHRYNAGKRESALLERSPRMVQDEDCAYDEDELYTLYRGFAGQWDELQRLADFMGCGNTAMARPLLNKFITQYKKL